MIYEWTPQCHAEMLNRVVRVIAEEIERQTGGKS